MNHILVVKPLDVYSGVRLLKWGRVLHDLLCIVSFRLRPRKLSLVPKQEVGMEALLSKATVLVSLVTHACVHIHMHAYTHACVHIHMHAYTHACIYTCMRAYTHACVHIHMHACIYTCMRAYTHACVHIHMHACIYTCMRAYILYMHIYLSTYLLSCSV